MPCASSRAVIAASADAIQRSTCAPACSGGMESTAAAAAPTATASSSLRRDSRKPSMVAMAWATPEYCTRPAARPVTHALFSPRCAVFGYSRAMAKAKAHYTCEACGGQQPKWQGQCPDCGAWNSLTETAPIARRADTAQWSGGRSTELKRLESVDVNQVARLTTGLGEFDRVLGGGLVPGSVVLLGGDPGIGKSTLLLRALANLAS